MSVFDVNSLVTVLQILNVSSRSLLLAFERNTFGPGKIHIHVFMN